MFLRYDGGFEGFLCAAATALREGESQSVLRPSSQMPLLSVREIPTVSDFAERMGPYLADRIGPEVPETIYQAWLSEQEGIDDAIVAFLRIGLQSRTDPIGLRQIPSVATVAKASQRVVREAHSFLGLVRFRLRGRLYVSEIEPDTDILPLIGDHFADRFHDQPFVIHDIRRGRAILHPAEGDWEIVETIDRPAEVAEAAEEPRHLGVEDPFERMWRRYFKALAIEERIQPALQQKHLPKKRWRHLVEEPGRTARPGRR